MILLPLVFSLAASAAPKKSACGHWDAHGAIAEKAARFDKLIAKLQTSKNPDSDLAKFAAKEGLPFVLDIYDGMSLPQVRLERRTGAPDDKDPYKPKPKEPVSRGEYVVFAKTMPTPVKSSTFYEFVGPKAKRPLHKWVAPAPQALPGDVQGDEMIFKLALQSLCEGKNFWNTGIAVKPNGKFRVVAYKNDQYPSIVANCPASDQVFKASPMSTCGEVTDSKKKKRLLVYQLTKE